MSSPKTTIRLTTENLARVTKRQEEFCKLGAKASLNSIANGLIEIGLLCSGMPNGKRKCLPK